MTNDRDLLERAARAAGIAVEWHVGCGDALALQMPCTRLYWNPLNDDGDALRLAVEFRIHLQPDDTHIWATTLTETVIQSIGDDRLAATRRAIVRAAAALANDPA